MDRRDAGKALLLGLAAAGVGGAASAQGFYAPAPPEVEEATETGRLGAFSLYASRSAQRRAGRTDLREFADFEADEQATLAEILQEITGRPAPPLSYAQQEQLDRLEGLGGAAFERDYVRLQVDGHRRLLAVQERYLAYGRSPPLRHVALLARGRIREHLRLLSDIERRGA